MSTNKTEKLLQKAAGSAASSAAEKKPRLVIKLFGSFIWDGKEITEVDLSGLYEMTAEDMFLVDEQMRIR